MASDACDRITDLYHAALQRAPDDRHAFLEHACAGDDVLRQDVESLLRYESGAARFLKERQRRWSPLDRQTGPTC